MVCKNNTGCQDDILFSWGRNNWGQLGIGSFGGSSNTPIKVMSGVTGLFNPMAITAGGFHSLAIDPNYKVWTWGRNDNGQLGDGTFTSSNIPVRVSKVTGLSNVIAITAGRLHSLAIDCNGQAWGWGGTFFGELGDGTSGPGQDMNTPVQVSESTGLSNVIAIAAGGFHSLAIDCSGQPWAWGRNWFGQLGNGTSGPGVISSTPVQVSGLSNVIAISAGSAHSLAIDCSGQPWAWGRNNNGQLGNNTTTDSNTPVQVSGLTDVVAISAGGGRNSVDDPFGHSLAIDSAGQAWAWGLNNWGQLGDGSNSDSDIPVQVSGLTDVIAISAGGGHSLAIDSNGRVWAWGLNSSGQLGDGNFTNSDTPIQISGGT
ncbi:RCC1 domain-containing protein [Anaeromicrobium sediminis]|nr:hypothetical protein [Anaeromicrobium sediminis]